VQPKKREARKVLAKSYLEEEDEEFA